MREFASVWKWTVEERKGIFTPSPERGTLKLNERPPPIPVKQHLLLIKVSICTVHVYACTCICSDERAWFGWGYNHIKVFVYLSVACWADIS